MLTRTAILDRIEEEYGDISEILFDDEMNGICINCGEFTSPVEPDARGYYCPDCGAHEVFGLEEIVITLM